MSKRFHILNGMDDVNLKQAYLNSLPEPLGDEVLNILDIKRMNLQNVTIGELFQYSLIALDKMCNQKKFLTQIEQIGKKIGKACDRLNLKIKCKGKEGCTCKTKKKNCYFTKRQHFSNRSKKQK